MQTLPLKLAPGSDLRLSLKELAQRDGISGFVLGVVGNLTRASFQCPGQAEPTVLEGDLEVITLNGTFSCLLLSLALHSVCWEPAILLCSFETRFLLDWL